MATAFLIDGALVPEERAVVPVLDRGFLYGDGVYEVLRTSGGAPVDQPPRVELERWIAEVLEAAGSPDSYVRIVVTRGGGPIGLDIALADGPRTVLIATPLVVPSAEQYARGVALVTVGVERTSARALDPAIKSGNYLNNILGLTEAKRHGAYEAIFLNAAGHVTEASTANLFFVLGGRLVTPRLDEGILAGITRRRILELAAAENLEVDEPVVTRAELATVEEAFLSSSIRGVLPVASIDGRALSVPGPITRRLMTAYDGFLAATARGGRR
jgi:branched-chain amino acid aminotransferase